MIPIKVAKAQTLAKKLYAEVRRRMDANGNTVPICRIEVRRLLGTIYLHCVPVGIAHKKK